MVLGPVVVRPNTVVLVGCGVIVTLEICELVMFPVIVRSIVAPLAVVAGTVVADGVGEGDGAGVGTGVAVGAGVEVDVSANVAVIVWEAVTSLKVYDDAAATSLPSTVKDAME
jgi:hypothetical protein